MEQSLEERVRAELLDKDVDLTDANPALLALMDFAKGWASHPLLNNARHGTEQPSIFYTEHGQAPAYHYHDCIGIRFTGAAGAFTYTVEMQPHHRDYRNVDPMPIQRVVRGFTHFHQMLHDYGPMNMESVGVWHNVLPLITMPPRATIFSLQIALDDTLNQRARAHLTLLTRLRLNENQQLIAGLDFDPYLTNAYLSALSQG